MIIIMYQPFDDGHTFGSTKLIIRVPECCDYNYVPAIWWWSRLWKHTSPIPARHHVCTGLPNPLGGSSRGTPTPDERHTHLVYREWSCPHSWCRLSRKMRRRLRGRVCHGCIWYCMEENRERREGRQSFLGESTCRLDQGAWLGGEIKGRNSWWDGPTERRTGCQHCNMWE